MRACGSSQERIVAYYNQRSVSGQPLLVCQKE